MRRGGEGMDIAPQKTFPNQPMKMTLSRFIRRIRLLDLFLPIPSSLSALSPSLILEYKNKKIKSSYFCKQKRNNSRPSRIKIKNPILLASKFKKREREREIHRRGFLQRWQPHRSGKEGSVSYAPRGPPASHKRIYI